MTLGFFLCYLIFMLVFGIKDDTDRSTMLWSATIFISFFLLTWKLCHSVIKKLNGDINSPLIEALSGIIAELITGTLCHFMGLFTLAAPKAFMFAVNLGGDLCKHTDEHLGANCPEVPNITTPAEIGSGMTSMLGLPPAIFGMVFVIVVSLVSWGIVYRYNR